MLNYSKTIDYYEKYLKYKKKYLDLKNSNMIGGFPHFRSEAKINLLTDIELPYKIIFNIIDSFSDKNIKNTIDEIIEQKIERYSNSKSEDKQFYLSSDISATRVEPSGIITNQSKKKSGRTIEMFKETYNAEIKNVLPIYIKKLKSIMVNLDSIDNQKCDASSIKLNDMLNSKDKNLNSDFLRICSSKTE